MPAFAKVFDPTFEDLEDPYRHYDADGEPLEDRLYLPVGFDPGMKKTEVVALHPYPGHDQIVWQRTLPNHRTHRGLLVGRGGPAPVRALWRRAGVCV